MQLSFLVSLSVALVGATQNKRNSTSIGDSMKGFSKSVNNRYKRLCKRKQIGYGKKPATSEKFKNKSGKVKKSKREHRVRKSTPY